VLNCIHLQIADTQIFCVVVLYTIQQIPQQLQIALSTPHPPFTCRTLETVNATDTKDLEMQALLTTDPPLI
jgi:hypothetical protein